MTEQDVKEAVARVKRAVTHRGFPDMNDVRTVLDHLEAVERELVAMTVQASMHMTSAEELEKERDALRAETFRLAADRMHLDNEVTALRERLESAEREIAELKTKQANRDEFDASTAREAERRFLEDTLRRPR